MPIPRNDEVCARGQGTCDELLVVRVGGELSREINRSHNRGILQEAVKDDGDVDLGAGADKSREHLAVLRDDFGRHAQVEHTRLGSLNDIERNPAMEGRGDDYVGVEDDLHLRPRTSAITLATSDRLRPAALAF